MTKKSIVSVSRVVLLLILMSLLLTGCGCKHEWQAANCETPKTCTLCQLTEGEALGHTWVDATCETAKTCSVCQKTEGEALGHKWEDATTEAPKTCSVCQKTEGEKIVTDSRFTTAANKELFGTWKGIIKISGTELVDPAFTENLEVEYSIIFSNDGAYQENTKVLNEEEFVQKAEAFYIDQLYAEFTKLGLSQEQADTAMKTTYGMDVKTYAKKAATSTNYKALYANEFSGVYYVADGKLHSGEGWDKALKSDTYAIVDNALTIGTLTETFPDLKFTRS